MNRKLDQQVKDAALNQRKEKTKQFTYNGQQIPLLSLAFIPMLCVFIFNYLPMIGIIIAFKNFKYDTGVFGSEWVGFKNFVFFLTSRDFPRVAWNTVSLNLFFMAIGTICAVTLAVLLFELRSRAATKTIQTIMITPNFLSWVVVGYMVYAFLSPETGWVNSVLIKLGIGKINWYSKAKAWPFILALVSVWKSVGMSSVLYYATLMGIDNTLFEAATVDGAGRFRRILHIILPSLVHIIVITTILSIGGIFRSDFGLFYQVTRDIGALYSTTDVMDTYIFRTMRVVRDMSMASAAGFLQSVVGFVMVLLTNYIANRINPENALF